MLTSEPQIPVDMILHNTKPGLGCGISRFSMMTVSRPVRTQWLLVPDATYESVPLALPFDWEMVMLDGQC